MKKDQGQKLTRRGMYREGEQLKPGADLKYPDPNHGSLYAYGEPLSLNGARGLIKNFLDILAKPENAAMKAFFEEKVAFTFGKEALLALLAQENCEGIRFYLAHKDEKDWDSTGGVQPPEYWVDGITLAAVGVKKGKTQDAQDIGADKGEFIVSGYLDGPISDDIVNVITINGNDTKSIKQDGEVRETVPPTRLPFVGGLNEVISEYLSKKQEGN